jgi:hypothetical protein
VSAGELAVVVVRRRVRVSRLTEAIDRAYEVHDTEHDDGTDACDHAPAHHALHHDPRIDVR